MPTPPWADRIRRLYLSGSANQFVLHGNVNDRLLLGDPDSGAAELGTLADYLARVQLRKFDLVLSYELGAGLRVEGGEDLFRRLGFAEGLPADPPAAVGFLDRFLLFCVNLRRLPQGGGDAGRNHHIAVVLKSADLLFPPARQTRDYQLNSMALVVRSWSVESHFLEQNLAVFIVAENLNDLHHLLARNPRAADVEIPVPDADALREAFVHFEPRHPVALSRFAGRPEVPAARLAGATLSSVESLLKLREYQKLPLESADLSGLKKSLVEADAGGLIEFLEPDRTLEGVHGHEAVKRWMRQDIALWEQGDLRAMPMGYLISGPVGTGKTYLVECLAGEAGVPVVKMKNFRDRWVGSTEGNLERIFGLLHALGRCIVFVDEADQALGARASGTGDSGVSGRVYSMMAKEMSDTRNRGRILWILASSRPDLIEVDLKRPGRIDVKFPLFPACEPEEAYLLIQALCAKHGLELPAECPGDLLPSMPELLTPGAAEALAVKIYRLVRTSGAGPEAALRECLEGYQIPVPEEVMNFQIGLAVREASDLDFVPGAFRDR